MKNESLKNIFMVDTCPCGLYVFNDIVAGKDYDRYIYFADYASNPLGTKPAAEIESLVKEWLKIPGHLEMTADTETYVSCNTASIALTKSGFEDDSVYTTVEGMKVLARNAAENGVRAAVILGTKYTVNSGKYAEILKSEGIDNVKAVAGTNLERVIAAGDFDNPEMVRDAIQTDTGGADLFNEKFVMILSCSCFEYAKDVLAELYPQAVFLNPVRNIIGELEERVDNVKDRKDNVSIIFSGEESRRKSILKFVEFHKMDCHVLHISELEKQSPSGP